MAAGVPDFYYPQFAPVIPAGTAIAAPISVNIATGPKVLLQVEVRIPPGPNGQAGFRIEWTGVPLVPWGMPPGWIVGNDETLSFPVGLEVDTELVFIGYNTDIYAHTFYLRLTTTDIDRGGAALASPVALDAIDNAAGRMTP